MVPTNELRFVRRPFINAHNWPKSGIVNILQQKWIEDMGIARFIASPTEEWRDVPVEDE